MKDKILIGRVRVQINVCWRSVRKRATTEPVHGIKQQPWTDGSPAGRNRKNARAPFHRSATSRLQPPPGQQWRNGTCSMGSLPDEDNRRTLRDKYRLSRIRSGNNNRGRVRRRIFHRGRGAQSRYGSNIARVASRLKRDVVVSCVNHAGGHTNYAVKLYRWTVREFPMASHMQYPPDTRIIISQPQIAMFYPEPTIWFRKPHLKTPINRAFSGHSVEIIITFQIINKKKILLFVVLFFFFSER